MAAGLYNICGEQGGAIKRQFTLMDINGRIIDLTGFTAQFSAKLVADIAGALLLNYVSSPQESHITLGGQAGTITLNFSGAETEFWTFNNAVYDIFLVSPSGVRTRVLEGTIALQSTVTHI